MRTLKFIISFILCAVVACGVGWCFIQLEFIVKSYTEFGRILHYIGLVIFSLFVGFYGALTITGK